MSEVRTPDGRVLEVLAAPAGDMPLLFHGGTPSAAVAYQPFVDLAAERGLRWITYSRPGYGRSTPHPGRTVAAVVDDVRAIVGALGADRFVTAGWSGGGPHALACAALLPDRCLAAASLAGVAPYDAGGLDFLAGMGEENVEEFGAAAAGFEAVSQWLIANTGPMATVTAADVADSLGDLAPAVDHETMSGPFAEWLAGMFRRSVSTGIAGWRDDDLAFVSPWGFDLAAITRPVLLLQGSADRMVPLAHGQWLADHVAGARADLIDGEGHMSLVVNRMPDVLDWLVASAR